VRKRILHTCTLSLASELQTTMSPFQTASERGEAKPIYGCNQQQQQGE